MGTTLGSTHRFLRLMDHSLDIMDCHFDFNLEVQSGSGMDLQSDVISRMKFWLDHCLENCIIIPCDQDSGADWLDRLDNMLMFAPSAPHDFLIQVLVHAKLQAIGGATVQITGSHMVSDHGNGFGVWFDGDPNELLPSQQQWMGERCYFAQPWWHRNDPSAVDIAAGPDDDITVKPKINLDWASIMPPPPAAPSAGTGKPAEIIRPNFTPRIITDD